MEFKSGSEVEYNEVIEDKSGKVFIVMYGKNNCPACDAARPWIEQYMGDQGYTDDTAKLYKLRVEDLSMDQIRQRDLRTAPTVHIYRNGEFLGGIRGGLGTAPYEFLEQVMGDILNPEVDTDS